MGCRPVLSIANGPAPARVLFVGEAPGRLGAARTGIPFAGDESGRRFELLLSAAGLERRRVFITNAVLCLPTDDSGRNRAPSSREVTACRRWLEETIDVVHPEVVVALGATALRSIAGIEPHLLGLRDAGKAPTPWGGRLLAALYHPGARTQVHRTWADQVEDWRRLGYALRKGVDRGPRSS